MASWQKAGTVSKGSGTGAEPSPHTGPHSHNCSPNQEGPSPVPQRQVHPSPRPGHCGTGRTPPPCGRTWQGRGRCGHWEPATGPAGGHTPSHRPARLSLLARVVLGPRQRGVLGHVGDDLGQLAAGRTGCGVSHSASRAPPLRDPAPRARAATHSTSCVILLT